MRCASRNKREFWYAVYDDSEPVETTDEWDNTITSGEYALVYEEPVLCKANISPSTGSTEIKFFGTDDDYDRIITLPDPNTPINENAILWLDTPLEEQTGSAGVRCGEKYYSGYDFIVKRVARYLNSAVVLCTAVTTS